MTAPPAFTTLPPNPSQTRTNAPGYTGTGSSGVIGSQIHSSTRHPSSTSTSGSGSGQGSGGGKSKTAIAVGTALGVFGLTTGVALTVWYFHRRHARSGTAFSPLDDDDEEPHSITAIPIAGSNEKGPRILAVPLGLLSMVGLGRQRQAGRSRHDIFADEDRSFDWEMIRREASVRASGSGDVGDVSARSSPHGWSNAVTTSLRNLARSAGRGSHSRESTTATDWEKRGEDSFSPEVALMAEALERDELPERAGPSRRPYTNPFADPNSSLEAIRDYLSGEPQENMQEERPPALRTTLPPKVDFVPLSPLLEQASQNSLSHSSSSHNTSSEQHAGSSSTLSGPPRSPRPSSILDLNPPPSEPIRRSNSWWSRFAKTPLLERKGSDASTRNVGGFIDFRDPNPPPPRLLTIEESTYSQHSPDVSESRRAGSVGISAAQAHMSRTHPSLYRETTHGRSASSLQTANTDTLERVGGTMDIVQRDGTLDSQLTALTNPFSDGEFGVAGTGRTASASSSAYGTNPLRALYVRGEPSYISTRTEESSSESHLPPPPPPYTPATPEPPDLPSDEPAADEGIDVRPPIMSANGNGEPHSPGVSERVRAFERRMSQDIELPPPPTNTRRREERSSPRPVVRYGLVPRPSLFVANPDGGPEREPRV